MEPIVWHKMNDLLLARQSRREELVKIEQELEQLQFRKREAKKSIEQLNKLIDQEAISKGASK